MKSLLPLSNMAEQIYDPGLVGGGKKKRVRLYADRVELKMFACFFFPSFFDCGESANRVVGGASG